MLSSLYSWVWDCYMDWGLWRSTEPGLYGLRSKITYPKWYYYFAQVQDLYLRLLWMIVVFADKNEKPWLTSLGYGTLLSVLELWRRYCWSLLRIENEQINNLEKYRDITEMPFYDDVQENTLAEESQYSDMVKNVLVEIRQSKKLD